MEFLLLLPLLFCITVFASIFLNKLSYKKQNPQPNDQNISLPPGKTGWPLIGETFDFYSNIRKGVLENFVTDRVNKYSSKVFKTSLIGHPVAILCGPEGNKFLFSNEQNLLRVWFPTTIDKIFPNSRNVSIADFLKKSRRIVSSFLKADAIRRHVGTMDAVMKHHLVTDWDRCEKVTVLDVVKKYTVTLGCRLFLSIDDPRKIEEFTAAMVEMEDGLISLPMNFPGMPLNRAIKASRMVRKEIEAMLTQRKIDVGKEEDILSQLLLATADEDGKFFNESDISSLLLNLLQGGYSTINGTLTFIIKYLGELPHVYNEVLYSGCIFNLLHF